MRLKSEMVKHSWDEIENIIDINKAVEIAEKYATEMCEKQKGKDLQFYMDNANSIYYGIRKQSPSILNSISERYNNAPLATEIK